MPQTIKNYLRMHRRKSGLSQRELARLVGYKDQWQISRHERSDTVPSLMAALSYQAVFRVPVSQIFNGMHFTAVHVVEENIRALERSLSGDNRSDRIARLVARKVQWMTQRQNLQ
jgi:DNA-binding XRE family transcriptional regulator